MLKAVTRQATAVDNKVKQLSAEAHHPITTAYFFDHYATKEDIAVMVTENDFMSAHQELVPSVSAGELAHYEKVRAMFEGGRDAQAKSAGAPATGNTSRPSSRGVGKSAAAKGKGKAVADGEGLVNGRVSTKGKGKAPAGFQDGTASDDDELY